MYVPYKHQKYKKHHVFVKYLENGADARRIDRVV